MGKISTYKKIKSELSNLKLHQFKTLEISSVNIGKKIFNLNLILHGIFYFDICSKIDIQNKFDFIIADNVWEHLNILIELQKMFTIY